MSARVVGRDPETGNGIAVTIADGRITRIEPTDYAGTLYLSDKGGAVYSTTNYKDITPVEISGDDTTAALPPVDANGDGFDDNTGLPYVAPQVDANGDGMDDTTGLPMASITPAVPTATPVPAAPGGGDDFQG